MGKKGSWFSAIKRLFTHNSEGSNKKAVKEKKKGRGTSLRHGETKSFIHLFGKPSSIEKILGEADELLIRPPTSSDEQITPPSLPPRPTSPKSSSPRPGSHQAVTPPRAVSPKPESSSEAPPHPHINEKQKEIRHVDRQEPSLENQYLYATKIQAAYRGYLARRSFRALRGLVRLQGVVRGENVRRQTMNAMKQMQFLVRVQSQIQSRRIQMLENQALHHQPHTNDKEFNQIIEGGNHEDWDDSLLTKEEEEARLRQKVEAVIKRERAMSYAYSQQLRKANAKSAQRTHGDILPNGFPWWWNWLEHKLPLENTSPSQNAAKPTSEYKSSPRFHRSNHKNESTSPRSTRSTIPFRSNQYRTPSRTPTRAKPSPLSRASPASSAYNVRLRDDDSLMSCPPFSFPNYMAPTVSAKAKVRANSNPKERFGSTPGNDSKRRFSFPLTPNTGSFKSNKGSIKDNISEKDLSIDSPVSMPATNGRKPFNRFV